MTDNPQLLNAREAGLLCIIFNINASTGRSVSTDTLKRLGRTTVGTDRIDLVLNSLISSGLVAAYTDGSLSVAPGNGADDMIETLIPHAPLVPCRSAEVLQLIYNLTVERGNRPPAADELKAIIGQPYTYSVLRELESAGIVTRRGKLVFLLADNGYDHPPALPDNKQADKKPQDRYLTLAQADTLRAIYNFTSQFLRYPCVNDLCLHFQYDFGTISRSVNTMVEQGILSLSNGKPFLIRINLGQGADHLYDLPVAFTKKSRTDRRITKIQGDTLRYIFNHMTEHGISPSAREIQRVASERAVLGLLEHGIIYLDEGSTNRKVRVNPGFGMDHLVNLVPMTKNQREVYQFICRQMHAKPDGCVTTADIEKHFQKGCMRHINMLADHGLVNVRVEGRGNGKRIIPAAGTESRNISD